MTAVDQSSTSEPTDLHALDLKKPIAICNPADKNGEDASVPQHATHLESYAARITKTNPPQPKTKPGVHTVVSQFGLLKLDVAKVDRLLVPAAKALGTGGTKEKPKQPKFVRRDVSTNDQFGPGVLSVKTFEELCVPSLKLD